MTEVLDGRLLIAALGLTAVSAAASSAAQARTSSTNLSLVAYSTPAGAYSKIIPAFQATAAGKDVTFKQSYGASGTQAAAVHNGLPADVVNLSLAPDVSVLSQAGLVSTNWNKDSFGGTVTDSIVVFVVRKGNPKNIKTWHDLTKPGVQVINANPFTSGGARWNVMAAWGAQIKQHKTPEAGQRVPEGALQEHHGAGLERARLDEHVRRRQGRRAPRLRERGHPGPAGRRGHPVRAALGDDPDREPDRRPQGHAAPGRGQGLRRLHALHRRAEHLGARTASARSCRRVFKKWAKTFPVPKQLFTIRDIVKGGWPVAQPKFFDPNNGILKQIQNGS